MKSLQCLPSNADCVVMGLGDSCSGSVSGSVSVSGSGSGDSGGGVGGGVAFFFTCFIGFVAIGTSSSTGSSFWTLRFPTVDFE